MADAKAKINSTGSVAGKKHDRVGGETAAHKKSLTPAQKSAVWIRKSRRKLELLVKAHTAIIAEQTDKEQTLKHVAALATACSDFLTEFGRKVFYIGATVGSKGRGGDIAWWYQTPATEEMELFLSENGHKVLGSESVWVGCITEHEMKHQFELDEKEYASEGKLDITQVKELASMSQFAKVICDEGSFDCCDGELARHLEADFEHSVPDPYS